MKQSTKYLKILCNILVALVVLFFIVYIAPKLLAYFMPFVVGFILSLIANPVVRFLEKRIKIKRKYGTVIIIVLVIGVIGIGCYGIVTAIAVGVMGFAENLPQMYASAGIEVTAAIDQLESILEDIPLLNNFNFEKLGNSLENYINNLVSVTGEPTVSALGGIAKGIPDVLLGIVVGFLATYFFIADRDKIMGWLKDHLPASFHENVGRIYKQVLGAVGGYFNAQLKIMVIIYIIVLIGLMLLGVDFAWLIGFGIAFLDMLPIFGTGTVLCPWAVIKLFSGDYKTAIGMVVLYVVCLVVHQLMQPKLVGESVGMDPFATLFFMYVGYQVSGVIGMIVAIPIGMILINLFKAGAFDNLIWCVKEVVHDIGDFIKIDK